MTSRKTNLEAFEPNTAKPVVQDSIAKRPHRQQNRLGREVQARIGELLRTMYNSYVNQGIPPHLENLVRRIDEQD